MRGNDDDAHVAMADAGAPHSPPAASGSPPLASSPAFVNGDLAYFFCAALGMHLQPEGVQLVKAATVLGEPHRWTAWLMLHQSIGAATLNTADRLLLLLHSELFLGLSADGSSLCVSSPEPADAVELQIVRLDGGETLEVGALVEIRVAGGNTCIQLRHDGECSLAPSGSDCCSFVMQSDGASPGAPDW